MLIFIVASFPVFPISISYLMHMNFFFFQRFLRNYFNRDFEISLFISVYDD